MILRYFRIATNIFITIQESCLILAQKYALLRMLLQRSIPMTILQHPTFCARPGLQLLCGEDKSKKHFKHKTHYTSISAPVLLPRRYVLGDIHSSVFLLHSSLLVCPEGASWRYHLKRSTESCRWSSSAGPVPPSRRCDPVNSRLSFLFYSWVLSSASRRQRQSQVDHIFMPPTSLPIYVSHSCS